MKTLYRLTDALPLGAYAMKFIGRKFVYLFMKLLRWEYSYVKKVEGYRVVSYNAGSHNLSFDFFDISVLLNKRPSASASYASGRMNEP